MGLLNKAVLEDIRKAYLRYRQKGMELVSDKVAGKKSGEEILEIVMQKHINELLDLAILKNEGETNSLMSFQDKNDFKNEIKIFLLKVEKDCSR